MHRSSLKPVIRRVAENRTWRHRNRRRLIGGTGDGGAFALSTGAGSACGTAGALQASAWRRPKLASAIRTGLIFFLVELAPGCAVAGVFTTSKSRSAPVDWCAASLKGGEARALVVNAGNANAFTGKAGVKTVTEVAGAAAKLFGCKPKRNLSGFDGGDRRAARSRTSHQGHERGQAEASRERLGRCGAGHHDDRYLRQGGDHQGQDRAYDRDDQRDCQRFGHDRAGHGDDAGVPVH